MFELDGTPIYTLNISQDKETGIGTWSEDDFINAVKSGIVPNKQAALRYPMQPYFNLSDEELRAVHAYMKTVPPIKNKVETSPIQSSMSKVFLFFSIKDRRIFEL